MSYVVANNRAFVSEVAPTLSRDGNCFIVYTNKEGGGTQFDHKKDRRPNSLWQPGTLPRSGGPLTFPLQRFNQHNNGFDQHIRGSTRTIMGSTITIMGSPRTILGSTSSIKGSTRPTMGLTRPITGSTNTIKDPIRTIMGSTNTIKNSIRTIRGSNRTIGEKVAQRKNANIHKEITVTIKRQQTIHWQRKVTSTLSMVVALFGLILAILNKELELFLETKPQDIMPLIIMATITISSIILTVLLIWYHILAMQIKVIEKGLINWKFAISWKVVFQISAEIILANIHPYSLNAQFHNEIMEEEAGTEEKEGTPGKLSSLIGIDTVFTILMFTRLYLVMRMITLHQRLTDTAYTGAFIKLRGMKITYSFSFKVLLNYYPWRMLVSTILIVLLLGSWSMRACEARKGDIHLVTEFLDQFWLVSITFLTVGFVLLWFSITQAWEMGNGGTFSPPCSL